jgi:hypothetical protein
MLSPDHALWLYDRLIPAKALCNGHNVRQIELDEITYFHIELAQHDVILANNTPAESYLDTGDRAAFDNGGDIVILHPQFAEPEWCTSRCGRMAEQGPIVERLRQRLLRRADLAPPPISAPAATYGSQRRSA